MTNTNDEDNKNRRSKLFIEPVFQRSFLLFVAVLSVLINVVYFVANMAFFRNFRKIGQDMELPEYHAFFRLLEVQEQQMGMVFGTAVVLVTLACLVFGLYMSNKVAGPIYRMRKYLEAHSRGEANASQLKFRDGDYFSNLAEAYQKAHGKQGAQAPGDKEDVA